ncbi:hypothetical protein CXF70_05840 [Planomicrobium sp. MB-3u-38]|nr:hypothetical protein CXF70_05840 [Planomicrobium sp. MB-3u-38]
MWKSGGVAALVCKLSYKSILMSYRIVLMSYNLITVTDSGFCLIYIKGTLKEEGVRSRFGALEKPPATSLAGVMPVLLLRPLHCRAFAQDGG